MSLFVEDGKFKAFGNNSATRIPKSISWQPDSPPIRRCTCTDYVLLGMNDEAPQRYGRLLLRASRDGTKSKKGKPLKKLKNAPSGIMEEMLHGAQAVHTHVDVTDPT